MAEKRKHYENAAFPVKGKLAAYLLASAVALSCQKAGTQFPGGEIVLRIGDDALQAYVDTKATPVTSIPSTLYWGTTTGTRGTGVETRKYHSGGSATSATVTAGTISTGQYQTATPTAYNHYVGNQNFSIPATGNVTMTIANNNTDVIAGWTAADPSTAPSVTLNHIFCRTGSVTLVLPSGYSQSAVSWTIKSKGAVSGTAGIYNLSTGAWTTASSTLAETALTGSSDLYLIPGEYTVTCSFTATKGDFTKSYTQVCDITLTGGRINNIVATSSKDDASQIVISVSLTAWTAQAVSGTIKEPLASFGGLNIAPGPIMWNGTTFVMENDWDRESFGKVYGKSNGSYYFNFVELGQFFDSRGNSFSTSSGDIDNAGGKVSWGGYSDWRMPTIAEWYTLTTGASPGTSRAGSSVNGNSSSKYAFIRLTETPHAGSLTPNGLLLFPDNKTITGKTLSGINNTTQTTGVTSAELQAYLDQGCVFLPSSGYRYSGWYDGGNVGYQWSGTISNESNSYNFYFSSSYLIFGDLSKTNCYSIVRLVRSL